MALGSPWVTVPVKAGGVLLPSMPLAWVPVHGDKGLFLGRATLDPPSVVGPQLCHGDLSGKSLPAGLTGHILSSPLSGQFSVFLQGNLPSRRHPRPFILLLSL